MLRSIFIIELSRVFLLHLPINIVRRTRVLIFLGLHELPFAVLWWPIASWVMGYLVLRLRSASVEILVHHRAYALQLFAFVVVVPLDILLCPLHVLPSILLVVVVGVSVHPPLGIPHFLFHPLSNLFLRQSRIFIRHIGGRVSLEIGAASTVAIAF